MDSALCYIIDPEDRPKDKEDPRLIASVRAPKGKNIKDHPLRGAHLWYSANPTITKEIYEDTMVYQADEDDTVLDNFKENTVLTLKKETGHFQLAPSSKEGFPNRLLIIAQPGAGKSYFCADYLKCYQKMYPDNRIFIVSRKNMKEEELFNGITFHQIDAEDPEFLENPLRMEEFKKCILLFDDTSTFTPRIVKAVNALRDDLIKVGRSRDIEVISTNHIWRDNRNTQSQFMSNTHLVAFTGSQKSTAIDTLRLKLGIHKRVLDFLFKQKSRTLIFSTTSPQYCIAEQGVYFIDPLDETLEAKEKATRRRS